MGFQQLNPKYDADAVQIEQFFRTGKFNEKEIRNLGLCS